MHKVWKACLLVIVSFAVLLLGPPVIGQAAATAEPGGDDGGCGLGEDDAGSGRTATMTGAGDG